MVGFTDETGTAEYNQKLSLKRAESVVNYLESQGIAENRLKAVGDGENDPIATNAARRAKNRRVEMYITADKSMIENAQQQYTATASL